MTHVTFNQLVAMVVIECLHPRANIPFWLALVGTFSGTLVTDILLPVKRPLFVVQRRHDRAEE